jgi:outer membrane protein OmpA-like peptidoglycan-associated protein
MTVGTPDVVQLRRLLFGKDYDELLALKTQFEHSDKYSASVAGIISEALKLRATQDNSLSEALAPTIEQALTQSICNSPQRYANVLYPVMGPAIRKSINQALAEALENLNQVLENSLSWRSWKWRFDAWRTGQTYAKVALLNTLVYQVEQVFLIHKESGLLLQHVASPQAISKDPEMVSGMLTAIQDFIADSFAVNQTDTLRTMTLGELTVLLEHGPHAVLAMVVRGTVPSDLPNVLMETSSSIHCQYAPLFKAFNGDADPFAITENLLADCLKSQQKRPQKRPPWLALLVLASLVGGAGYLIYQHYQQLAQQEAEAKQVQQQIVQTLNERLSQLQTHTTELKNSVSNLSDQQRQQITQQTLAAQQLATAEQAIGKLTREIEASNYPFALGKADVELDHPMLKQLGATIRDLISAAHRTGKTPQILIVGNADGTGTANINQKLAEQRAENLRDALVRGGVPAFALVAYSANHAGQPATLQKNERSTSYQVALF